MSEASDNWIRKLRGKHRYGKDEAERELKDYIKKLETIVKSTHTKKSI